MHKETTFKNPGFAGLTQMQRVTRLNNFDSWHIRFWREYFQQFSDPVVREEIGFVADAEK